VSLESQASFKSKNDNTGMGYQEIVISAAKDIIRLSIISPSISNEHQRSLQNQQLCQPELRS
jgi:hypothetical protein